MRENRPLRISPRFTEAEFKMVVTAATNQGRTPTDFVYREAVEAARIALLPPELAAAPRQRKGAGG